MRAFPSGSISSVKTKSSAMVWARPRNNLTEPSSHERPPPTCR